MTQEKSRLAPSTTFFINIVGIVVIFIVLKELQEIFIPFVIAYFLFFVFSPVNKYLEKKKIPNSVAIILDICIIIFVFGGISSVLVDSFTRLSQEIPQYEQKLNDIVSTTASSWGVKDAAFTHFKIAEILKGIDYKLLAGNLFTSTFTLLGTMLFVLFFFIFVLTGHKDIYAAIKKWYLKSHLNGESSPDTISRKEKENLLHHTLLEITEQIQNYVITKFVISLLVGIATAVILLLFKVDFVIVWAVLTFLFNFIPNIGALIAVILPVIIAMIQHGSIGYALILAAVLIVIHNIFGNIVEPKIFGKRLGMNPLVILLSLLLWGYIWGIVGALLSVPLTAILKIIISRSDSPNLQFLNDLMSD